jgi:uncharacterized FlaG/YvyC family protein
MANPTLVLDVERAGGSGFSGAQPYSGPTADRGQKVSRESERTQKPAAVSKPPSATEPSGDWARIVQDHESGRSFVQILDRKTGEVLYEIPPEEIQKLGKLLKETTGSMVDTVA